MLSRNNISIALLIFLPFLYSNTHSQITFLNCVKEPSSCAAITDLKNISPQKKKSLVKIKVDPVASLSAA